MSCLRNGHLSSAAFAEAWEKQPPSPTHLHWPLVYLVTCISSSPFSFSNAEDTVPHRACFPLRGTALHHCEARFTFGNRSRFNDWSELFPLLEQCWTPAPMVRPGGEQRAPTFCPWPWSWELALDSGVRADETPGDVTCARAIGLAVLCCCRCHNITLTCWSKEGERRVEPNRTPACPQICEQKGKARRCRRLSFGVVRETAFLRQ